MLGRKDGLMWRQQHKQDPEILHTAEPFTNEWWVFVYVFISQETWVPLRPKYPKKDKNPKLWRKKRKQKKKHSKKARLGHIEQVQNFNFSGSYLSKTAWTLDSEGIRGFMLESACTSTCIPFVLVGSRRTKWRLIFWLKYNLTLTSWCSHLRSSRITNFTLAFY